MVEAIRAGGKVVSGFSKNTCSNWSVALHGYIDYELDAAHAYAFEQHVATCAKCATELASYREMKMLLGKKEVRWPIPYGLHAKILGAIDAEASVPVSSRHVGMRRSSLFSLLDFVRQWSFVPSFAALAAALLLVVMPPTQQNLVQEQLLSSHVRSLLVSHLTDVATSDQHTVKPWFNGKIDFSPPVVDLATEGFPLVGGRVDYVGGRVVAALVYRRHGHVINLFIWPSPESASVSAAERDGYSLLSWSKDGLIYWAVSDLAAAEIDKFRELFRG
jgi:anti-sigma factor RsiW